MLQPRHEKTSERLEKAERSLQRATMRKTNLAAVFASRLAKKARVSFDDAAAGLEEEDPEVAKRRRIREAILLFAVRLKRMQDLAEETGEKMADIMDVGDLCEKFNSFGWHALEINGHNIKDIFMALNEDARGKPKAIIAKTIKGKGFSFSEENNAWHHAVLTEKLYNLGLAECRRD